MSANEENIDQAVDSSTTYVDNLSEHVYHAYTAAWRTGRGVKDRGMLDDGTVVSCAASHRLDVGTATSDDIFER